MLIHVLANVDELHLEETKAVVAAARRHGPLRQLQHGECHDHWHVNAGLVYELHLDGDQYVLRVSLHVSNAEGPEGISERPTLDVEAAHDEFRSVDQEFVVAPGELLHAARPSGPSPLLQGVLELYVGSPKVHARLVHVDHGAVARASKSEHGLRRAVDRLVQDCPLPTGAREGPLGPSRGHEDLDVALKDFGQVEHERPFVGRVSVDPYQALRQHHRFHAEPILGTGACAGEFAVVGWLAPRPQAQSCRAASRQTESATALTRGFRPMASARLGDVCRREGDEENRGTP
mmetsp:Transcript_119257/g.337342  ORF Transcript_119257/g.337342 Transcript_119257/m.337342 type:complete len:290 (-) Transcript_119257:71-940(-)